MGNYIEELEEAKAERKIQKQNDAVQSILKELGWTFHHALHEGELELVVKDGEITGYQYKDDNGHIQKKNLRPNRQIRTVELGI